MCDSALIRTQLDLPCRTIDDTSLEPAKVLDRCVTRQALGSSGFRLPREKVNRMTAHRIALKILPRFARLRVSRGSVRVTPLAHFLVRAERTRPHA
jgi:hypothetical protein